MRLYISILFFIIVASLQASADNELSYKVLKIADRVFYNTNKPVIKVLVSNKGMENCHGNVICRIETDSHEHVYDFEQDFSVAQSDSAILSFKFGLDKGFYRVSVFANGKLEEQVNMAYEPELVDSDCDKDFDPAVFYRKARYELEKLPVYALVEKVKKTGAKYRDVYKVKIRSLEGVYIEGYYAVPKKSGIYSVVLTCLDKNETLMMPDIDGYQDRIDFVISPRKSFVHNELYYVNSYMDLIRAIDFIYGRKEADLKNISLQGIGEGGAMVLAVAALDKRVASLSVYAPGYSNENILDKSLAYDVKNLSGHIECPVVMGVGLEDKVIPPAANFGIYNLIKSNKEYYIFIEGHYPPTQWKDIADNFYKKHKR